MSMRSLRLLAIAARPRPVAARPAVLALARPVPRAMPAMSLRWSSSASSSSSSSSTPATPESSSSSPASDASAIEAPAEGAPQRQQIGQIEPMLAMTFTCTAGAEKGNPTCGHRSTHEFKKRSYEKGVVIVQCPKCEARHLIADQLGWFNESTEDGKLRTIEDLMRAKGEEITKGRVDMNGDIEYAP